MSISTGPGRPLAHDARNVGGVAHQIAVLHHRVRDAGDVRFLEGVLAEIHAVGLAGDHDQRRRIHLRGEQAGHGVGGAGPGGHQHDARPAGRPREAVGHVRGTLLVPHQDQLDRRVDERIEDRDRGAAGEPEDVLHALALEAADQDFGTGRQAAARRHGTPRSKGQDGDIKKRL
jgi:hypothetical protein